MGEETRGGNIEPCQAENSGYESSPSNKETVNIMDELGALDEALVCRVNQS